MDTRTVPDSRTSEADFRTAMPKVVDHFHILHVDGYQPGGPDSHPTAIAVTRHLDDDFSTHMLIWVDEDDWCLDFDTGNYGFLTFQDARKDVEFRAEQRILLSKESTPAG
ncbi:hypothetical protein GCM10012275_28050 [Longimycelium tulufanense]|uniref:Uncharacterized protein n=1 Tax=Longimycelium tulufanense TaxID=907463 RepID=A0A8J3CBN2_9PSEU|nr:hypothetical protein [Longimycelium tulufanense]GGM55288.1 hypothetical protein GCM10012275_28050 [Longimycelium tulufanense]